MQNPTNTQFIEWLRCRGLMPNGNSDIEVHQHSTFVRVRMKHPDDSMTECDLYYTYSAHDPVSTKDVYNLAIIFDMDYNVLIKEVHKVANFLNKFSIKDSKEHIAELFQRRYNFPQECEIVQENSIVWRLPNSFFGIHVNIESNGTNTIGMHYRTGTSYHPISRYNNMNDFMDSVKSLNIELGKITEGE